MRTVLAVLTLILTAGAAQAQFYEKRYYDDGPRYRERDRGPSIQFNIGPKPRPSYDYYQYEDRRYRRWYRGCRNEIRINNVRVCLDN